VPTGSGDFNRSFHMLLAFDRTEIKFLFAGPLSEQLLVERTNSREISPRRKCTTSESELAPFPSTPSTTAASAALSAGTMRVCRCRRLASKAIDKTPFTDPDWPQKRPFTADAEGVQGGQPIVFFEFQHTKAMGRSKLGPSLRTSAGARLMMIRFPYGQRNELLEMAFVKAGPRSLR
jgi:hypothetical protein